MWAREPYINVKVKGNGQECPFHTGKSKSNINVKNGTAGVRGSHLSQKTRKMGHPSSDEGAVEVKINVKGSGRGGRCTFL